MKNKITRWAVFSKRGKLISLGETAESAKRTALEMSGYRWTYQTLNKDFKNLEYTVKKVEITY